MTIMMMSIEGVNVTIMKEAADTEAVEAAILVAKGGGKTMNQAAEGGMKGIHININNNTAPIMGECLWLYFSFGERTDHVTQSQMIIRRIEEFGECHVRR